MRKVTVLPERLYEFTLTCFLKLGVPRRDAGTIADHLVLANLRGVDSHGVIRIPYYVEGVRRGYVRVKVKPKIISEGPATMLIDGNNGLGIPIAARATEHAIKKAKSTGIAAVSVKNLGHVGMLAYYTLKIAKNQLIGFATANSTARVAPWGGADAILGTNPLSFGFPAGDQPILIDMATSVVADFKIKLAALKGEKIPEGLALSRKGEPTTDPKEALEGCLLPFGAYKGYALSLVVEILSAAICGAPLSKFIFRHPSTQGGFFVMALNPAAFRSYDEYEAQVEKLISVVKSCSPASGSGEVLLPGEPERRVYEKRVKDGIPIDQETWMSLVEVSKQLGVSLPKAKST